MSDERLSLPSASSRARDSRCPGALNLIRKLRADGVELEREEKSWTASGTRIHAAAAGETVELDHAEETALETVEGRLTRLRKDLAVPDDAVEIREKRLWLLDGLRRVASGAPDVVWRYFDNERAEMVSIIPDIKTGWGEVDSETVNLQFRGYAVLEWVNAGRPERARVVVAAIRAHGARPAPVEYDAEALNVALLEWLAEIAACNVPDAPRCAGPQQCKYCPAKLHCAEARAAIPEMAAITIHESGLTVTNEEIASLLDRCSHAEKMIGEIKAEAKRRLEADPASIAGWELAPGAVKQSVTNSQLVFERFLGAGGSQEAFAAACSITKTALTEITRTATGLKGKALNERVAALMDGATASKQAAPSLKRKEASHGN